jgi:hypothetical protein
MPRAPAQVLDSIHVLIAPTMRGRRGVAEYAAGLRGICCRAGSSMRELPVGAWHEACNDRDVYEDLTF